ncbi:type I secretion system permease/ATPase [Orbus wheelerorum]|uniref:type I secretion system permease/ATPase n=1 Tax=Orbus wheelerorum TaxID=3074111 RepID=UPI00370DD250
MKTNSYQQWLNSFLVVANHYGLDVSKENAQILLDWGIKNTEKDKLLNQMARQFGLSLRFQECSDDIIDPWRLPLIVDFGDDKVGVVTRSNGKDKVSVLMGADDGLSIDLTLDEVRSKAKRVILLRPESSMPDARVDDYIKPHVKNWFWEIVLKDWRRYLDIIIASLIANLLALAAVIFSMQVYDRVVPAQSQSTLWVLFGGVAIAILFEFLLRLSRTHISDATGKKIDLKISDKVFGRALRLRNDVRPASTGSFVAQLRELDQLRELIASTTINALADVPFVLLFLIILFLIGGPLAFVAVAALPLLIIPGILAQRPLAKLAKEGMRESAIRNAIMIESVESNEDIKLLRAEQRFQNQWNQANSVAGSISLRQRKIISFLVSWSQELQSLTYATVLLVGAYLVIEGSITTGTLVGSSILSSRLIGPLSQWTGVLSRLQQAKVAYKGLTDLMAKAVDNPPSGKMLHRPVIKGDYHISSIEFRYAPTDKSLALQINSLTIKPGERIGILGRMGAGKSTLLQMLCCMVRPTQGVVQLDGANISVIDQADVRRDVTMLSQNSRLFYGSIRDNLVMGNPLATDKEIIQALVISGAAPIVQQHGIDYVIREGGMGLSGGQKQALLLARLLIKDPNVLLLDEPTASMDEVTEKHVVSQLSEWLDNRSLILATHKPAMLKLVDRIIVIEQGKIVLDGPKERILATLSNQGQKKAAQAAMEDENAKA